MGIKENLEYVLVNLEKCINESKSLEDKEYLELTKKEVVYYLNNVYKIIKEWEILYNNRNYDAIKVRYKEVESLISELELCLADYKDIFNIDGISYAIFEIGKKLKVL